MTIDILHKINIFQNMVSYFYFLLFTLYVVVLFYLCLTDSYRDALGMNSVLVVRACIILKVPFPAPQRTFHLINWDNQLIMPSWLQEKWSISHCKGGVVKLPVYCWAISDAFISELVLKASSSNWTKSRILYMYMYLNIQTAYVHKCVCLSYKFLSLCSCDILVMYSSSFTFT